MSELTNEQLTDWVCNLIDLVESEFGKDQKDSLYLRELSDRLTQVERLTAERDALERMNDEYLADYCAGVDYPAQVRAALARAEAAEAELDKTRAATAEIVASWQQIANEERRRAETAEAWIAAALALHHEAMTIQGISPRGGGLPMGVCQACDQEWPCPTVAALSGEPT